MDRRGVSLVVFGLAILCEICDIASSATYPGDTIALQALKNSLIDSSNSLRNWGEDEDPCGGWTGVYCVEADYPTNLISSSNFSHVTELRLLQLNLTGQLAPEIGNLSALTYLNVMWNQISGSIPSTIGELKNLKFLLLSGNQLTGIVPWQLGFLPNLHKLQLDANRISGPVPDTFLGANLPNLEHIQMNYNSLNGSIPAELATLSTLRHLLLDNNKFTGTLPVEIASMPNLLTIQLDNNEFDRGASIPQEYGTMSQLIKLSLGNCDLKGAIPDFSRLTHLAVLDLNHNSLTGSISSAALYNSANLTALDLSYNNITGSIPDYLKSSLPALQFLELRRNNLDGLIPSNVVIGRNSSSKIFDLQENSITTFANSSDLLVLQRQGNGAKIWLSGNPFCKSPILQQNKRLCVPRNVSAVLDVGAISVSTQRSCALCSAPSALAPASEPDDCRCAVPIAVQFRLESPRFVVFDPYVQQFASYLASGLDLAAHQVQIRDYAYQPGPRFLYSLLLFPTTEGFDDSEVKRIYDSFAKWKIPDSDLFGPYELILFSHPAASTKSGKSASRGLSPIAIAGIVVGVLVFVVLKTLCMYHALRAWVSRRNSGWDVMGEKTPPAILSRRRSGVRNRSYSRIKVTGVMEFSFEEIVKATDNFSAEKLVGEGGYGKVYSGMLDDGRKVAVKRAEESSFQGAKEFETEIMLLSRVHHRNLVSLVGYCNDENEQVLVYEFIAYGSLEHHLTAAARVPLNFVTRLQIALGSARGIHYLHTQADPPIYHRDVKASNILLDEMFHAKVADFGISKLAPRPDLGGALGHVSTAVKGTPGYVDPEYHKTLRLTDKSDVYSFGVLILVMVTGMEPITEGRNLVREVGTAFAAGELSKVVDFRIRGTYSHRAMQTLTTLALLCCRDNPDERPTIKEVVAQLEQLWKEAYTDADSVGGEYSGDLRHDLSRSEDSFIEIDPSLLSSSGMSSTVWTSSENQGSGSNQDPDAASVFNFRDPGSIIIKDADLFMTHRQPS